MLVRRIQDPREKHRALRRILERSKATPVIGVFSPLVALMAEEAGFEAIYLSGAALSASLALPDLGLITLNEVADAAKRISSATNLPLIVDADTGFGEALNVMRAVRELETAGASGIQLEDQVLPKKCGHLEGKRLISSDEMAAKIKAAVEARTDKNFVIIARTDARGVDGFEEAVRRARIYLEAGADVIFPEALQSEEEFKRFAEEVEAPLLANMTEFGKSPITPLSRLSDLGYRLVLYPVTLLRIAMAAVEEALKTLKQEGTQEQLIPRMQPRSRLYQLIRYHEYEELDKKLARWSRRDV